MVRALGIGRISTMDDVERLHRLILSCRRCEDGGYIERAAPVVAGQQGNRIMLIGQAPGITELQIRRPFAGRAGKELFRWLASVGISEDNFRQQVYMTAVTKCFPGKASNGAGDRRPSNVELGFCRPWLEQQFQLIRPAVVLLVGGMAIERYFKKAPLTELIGRRFQHDGMVLIPLPHPSGASRWLNAPAHRELLACALEEVRAAWQQTALAKAALAG